MDGFTISISNDNSTVVADEGGSVSSFANTNTSISVFSSGTAPLTYDDTSPYANNSYRVTQVASGVTIPTPVVSSNVFTVGNITQMPGETGSVTYTIVAKDSLAREKIFEKVHTFTKSRRGAFGKTVELVASKYVINYSTAGTETDSITFTATGRNFVGVTPYFEFLVDGNVKQSASTGSGTPPNKTFSLADADEPAIGGTKTILVRVRADSASGDIVAEDSVSIYGIQDGSDAVSGFLTNESHSVGADFIGNSTLGAAGGTFKVFIGGTEVTTSCTFSVNSETGVDMSVVSGTGVYSVSNFPDNSLTGTATFRATIPANIAGTSSAVVLDKTYTISKSQGAAPVIVGELTNNSHSFTADVSGTISSTDLSNGGGTFNITKDGTLVNSNSNVTFSLVSQTGITTSINSASGEYTISAFPTTTSTGTATFRATIASGFTGTGAAKNIDLIYTASKSQSGVSGSAIAELDLHYPYNAYGSSTPSSPSTGTYNFSTGVIASIPTGWSQTRPATSIGTIVYKVTALATESSPQSGVSGTLSWSSIGLGDKGIGDTNFIFKYSASQPATPSATSIATSNGIPTGWSDNIPTNPNNGSKLWSCKGKATLTGSILNSSFNYNWETPVVHVQDKADVGLSAVDNESSATIRGGNITGTVGGVANATMVDGVARANLGFNTSGDVQRNVPTTFGGTGSSDVGTFRNSSISVSQGNNGVFTLQRGTPANITTTISKNNLGLNYTDGATVGASWGSNISSQPANNQLYNSSLSVSQGSSGVFTLTRGGPAAVTTTISKSNLGLNYTDGATVGAPSGTNVGSTAAATVESRANGANQDSTSTIRNGVTTYETDKAPSIFWSNLSGNFTPSFTTYDVNVIFRNGSGTIVQNTTIRIQRSTTSLLAATVNAGSSAGVSLGSATSSGSTQTTTITKNGITVKVTGFIIDGSGWTFKTG